MQYVSGGWRVLVCCVPVLWDTLDCCRSCVFVVVVVDPWLVYTSSSLVAYTFSMYPQFCWFSSSQLDLFSLSFCVSLSLSSFPVAYLSHIGWPFHCPTRTLILLLQHPIWSNRSISLSHTLVPFVVAPVSHSPLATLLIWHCVAYSPLTRIIVCRQAVAFFCIRSIK